MDWAGKVSEAIGYIEENRRIFSEWLPASKEYEVADGFNIEMYSDPGECKLGTEDPNYYSEIWIPVRKKED